MIPVLLALAAFHVQLLPALGKDVGAFSKAFGVAFKREQQDSPDMVKGKPYTKEQLKALPQIKMDFWTAPLPKVGKVILSRKDREKAITLVGISFKGAQVDKLSAGEVGKMLGLPEAKEGSWTGGNGAWSGRFRANGSLWTEAFFPRGFPAKDSPANLVLQMVGR